MVVLKQHFPSGDLKSMGSNVILHPNTLPEGIRSSLDTNGLDKFSIPSVVDNATPLKQTILCRHQHSKYNEYIDTILSTELYKSLLQEEDSLRAKAKAIELLQDFKQKVGLDHMTDLSPQGCIQGEAQGKLFAELVNNDPTIFPDLVAFSPYLRTRKTAYYLLKYVKGLDIDIDSLVYKEKYRDHIVGSFKGKKVTLRAENLIRERNYGIQSMPSILKKYFNEGSSLYSHAGLLPTDIHQLSYFAGDLDIAEQTKMEERAEQYSTRISTDNYKNRLLITHELFILGFVGFLLEGSYPTFSNFFNNWRPQHGSMSFISQTQEIGQNPKFNLAGYNLMLKA